MPEFTDLYCDSPETAEAVKAYLDEQIAQAEAPPNISAYIHKTTLRLTYGGEVDRQDWDMQLLGYRDGYEKGIQPMPDKSEQNTVVNVEAEEFVKPETDTSRSQIVIPKDSSEKAAPNVICLCGSTRFIEVFAIKTWELEREGNIVLGCTLLPMWYCNVPSHFGEATGTKEQCDEIHKRKIDLADEVLILDVDGYIGESTRSEIEYATKTGKPIRYLSHEQPSTSDVFSDPARGKSVGSSPESSESLSASISVQLEEIRARRVKITAPWTMTVPSIEIGYTNGAILWDGEECNFGEVAPNDEDYMACSFGEDDYRNSNADFIINAPTDIDKLLDIIDSLKGSDLYRNTDFSQYEDDLPFDMPQADYDKWFAMSKVDGVRVGPKYPFVGEDLYRKGVEDAAQTACLVKSAANKMRVTKGKSLKSGEEAAAELIENNIRALIPDEQKDDQG